MKFGFITNNLAVSGQNDLLSLSWWAKEHGFADMELGPSIPLDVDKAIQAAEETGIRPTGLI